MSESPRVHSARSPFAGCGILVAAVAMIIFLIGFSIYALFQQFEAIRQFTEEKPRQIEITPTVSNDQALETIRQKLRSFHDQLSSDGLAEISLDANQMNLWIASDDRFKELRGTLRVEKITPDAMHLSISFPLNGKPRLTRNEERGIITSDMRYLNGTLIARPSLLKKEVVLQISEIADTPGKVPSEFIGRMSPYRISERYLTDDVLGPVMAKLTRVELKEGQLVFAKHPGEIPADALTDTQVASASQRLFIVLGIAATLFLVFMGVVIFRQQWRNQKNSNPS